MGMRSIRRPFLTALLALALAVRAFGLVAMPAPTPASELQAAADDWPFGPLVICTGHGTSVVEPGESGAPPRQSQGPGGLCTLCPGACLLGLAALVTLFTLLLLPSGRPAAHLPRRGLRPEGPSFATGFRSRAPPLLS